jgi:subtilisin
MSSSITPTLAEQALTGEGLSGGAKRYIIIEDPLAERLRRPAFELSPRALKDALLYRAEGEDVGASAVYSVPATAASQFSGALGLLAAELVTGTPWVMARARSIIHDRWPRLDARRGSRRRTYVGDAGVNIIDHRPGDLTLIEATEEVVSDLRDRGLQIVEDQPVFPAMARPPALRRRAGLRAEAEVKVIVRSEPTGKRVRGALVTGRMADGTVDSGQANGQGVVRLDVTGTELQDLWVDPVPGHWSWSAYNVQVLNGGVETMLQAVAYNQVDGLRHRYDDAKVTDGKGVRVGVIDTGILAHEDLRIEHEEVLYPGPTEADAGPITSPHGTHVAGIIASRARSLRRGIAPGVELESYRIYLDDEASGTFSLALAISLAIQRGCDIINLSLVQAKEDHLVQSRIREALDAGVIVVAAAGNDARGPLSFPASIDGVIAVGALGRHGTYPEDSASGDHVSTPEGADAADYIADFSNRLRMSSDFVAPGVGIISTVGNDSWGVLDGTSQAAPVVSGLAARVLVESGLHKHNRTVARAAAVIAELKRRADRLGFPDDLEGEGLIASSRLPN